MKERLKENEELDKDEEYENLNIAKEKKKLSNNVRIFKIIILSAIEIVIITIIILLCFNLWKGKDNYDNYLKEKNPNSETKIIDEKINYSFKAVYNIISTNESINLIDPLYLGNIKKLTIDNVNIKPCSNYTFSSIGNFTITMLLDTSNITSFYRMFYLIKNMISISFSPQFNTENITDMSYMFLYDSQLTSIDITNFKTSNVIDMSFMFSYCDSLTSINLSNFNTQKVVNMSYMFSGSGFKSLDLSKFDSKNLTNMYSMFTYCYSLEDINLSNFNSEKVVDMSYLFSYCNSLTSINLSGLNTKSVKRIGYMFNHCISLTSIDLSYFNTTKVEEMNSLFEDCISLKSVDLSNFNTENVVTMG